MKKFSRIMMLSFILGIGITICIAYVEAKSGRLPDAPKPQPVMETIDFRGLYFKGDRDVVASPDKKPVFSVLVVIEKPTRMTDPDKLGRMIRKKLIEKGVRVITGEVQAFVVDRELEKDLYKTLTETEKLMLLKEKTGADAFLVFDSIGPKEMEYDIYIKSSKNANSRLVLKNIETEYTPQEAIRRSIPAIVVQGRMVDSENGAIVAEFDIVKNIYKNEAELSNLKKQIPKYEYLPIYETEYYVEHRGCQKKTVPHKYIDHYQQEDIIRKQVVTTIDEYIPKMDEIDMIKADEELERFLNEVLFKII